jgi:hypothetical protein
MVTSLSQTAPTRVRCASPEGEDVVFTSSMEMFEDAVRREFCRPPDQTLLALARDGRIGRLLVADPWRSYAAAAARRRSLRPTEPVTVGERTAVRVRPHRLRRAKSTRSRSVAQAYGGRTARARRGGARLRHRRHLAPDHIGAAANFNHIFGGFAGFVKLVLPSAQRRGLRLTLEA